MKHLWEVSHPYYCNDGNYYSNDTHATYNSFDEFLEEFGSSDPDMNLLFRFDWKAFDPDNYDEEELADLTDEDKSDKLFIYWMGQRKGLFYSSEVNVKKDDEQRVIKFLRPRLTHLMSLWTPLINKHETILKEIQQYKLEDFLSDVQRQFREETKAGQVFIRDLEDESCIIVNRDTDDKEGTLNILVGLATDWTKPVKYVLYMNSWTDPVLEGELEPWRVYAIRDIFDKAFDEYKDPLND